VLALACGGAAQESRGGSGPEHLVRFVRELPVPSPREIFRRLEELGYRGQQKRAGRSH